MVSKGQWRVDFKKSAAKVFLRLEQGTQQDINRALTQLAIEMTEYGRALTANVNLAGVLLFAEHPERIKPQFIIKAIRYAGTTIHATQYLDTEDFEGPLRKVFDDREGGQFVATIQRPGTAGLVGSFQKTAQEAA